ncbi:alpha/beta hydrolase [Coralliovum pocilloporae]|uniref:alpha/beta hydrolase n=1 Tax=Coralliovum pocilloporae TaxID=3066369 RepID=UPI003306F7A2
MTDEPEAIWFSGVARNRVAGSVWPAAGDSSGVALLLHGGGQTRHAWTGTARCLSNAGITCVAIDHRGHGESDWVSSANYSFFDFADDVAAVAADMTERFGTRPLSIGASLGGLSTLLAEDKAGHGLFSGIVLVDVVPWLDPRGVAQITGFMRQHVELGFASLEDAAEAIHGYLPQRARPQSLDGLRKNLRLGKDGRYRWHWDPRFLDGPRPVSTDAALVEEALVRAASSVTCPLMLVRGQRSELVSEELAQRFRTLVPHAHYRDIAGAGHMVAGDRNDRFTDAIVEFLV